MRLISLLLVMLLLGSAILTAEAKVAFKDGSSDSNDDSSSDTSNRDNEDQSEDVEFPAADDYNLFSADEVVKFTDKLFPGGSDIFGEIPDKKRALKMLSTKGVLDDGELKEAGWNQVINDFVASDDYFETEADRDAYLRENENFASGIPDALPIHAKQLRRLLEFAASSDGIDLSEDAQIVVPLGTLYWENSGTGYNIPAFGATSYKNAQTGQIIYPDLEGEGFKDDIVSAPYTLDTTSDVFGWYVQKAVD